MPHTSLAARGRPTAWPSCYWLAIWRYRFLVPAMLAAIAVEQLLRLVAGGLKPLEVASPPPGAIGSYLVLPLALAALLWSLRKRPA